MVDIELTWDFGDPAGSEARFLEMIASSESAEEQALLWTQVARTYSLRGDFGAARGFLENADSGVHTPEVNVRIELERGRILNSSGDAEGAVPHFSLAADRANEAALEYLYIDALHMLAIADANRAEEWNELAIQTALNAESEKARGWLGSLYNNIGWTHFDEGNPTEALRYFELGLEERLRQQKPKAIHIARWTIARALRELGRIDEAFAIQLELEKEDPESEFVQEELAALRNPG